MIQNRFLTVWKKPRGQSGCSKVTQFLRAAPRLWSESQALSSGCFLRRPRAFPRLLRKRTRS